MATYTTADLLSLIKKRAFIPINQNTFDDDDILDMATDEMRSIIVPAVLSAREEWYVVNATEDISSSTTSITIPPRAIAGSLREVSFVRGDLEYNLPRQSLEDRVYQDNRGPLSSFYIEGNKIKFLGHETGSLRLYYHCRPGKLIKTTAAAQITSIDTGTNSVVVSSVPSTWAATNTVDFVQGKPHFEHKAVDNTISSIVSTTITFTNTMPTDLVVGDWVALEDESPVVQAPLEWFPYLAQAVAVQVLESLGDTDAAGRAEKRRDTLKKEAMRLITPRVEGETKKIVPAKNRAAIINPNWQRK